FLLQKLQTLRDTKTPQLYQLSQDLTLHPESSQTTDLYVRVVILPALIRGQIEPDIEKAQVVSLLAILGSVFIALLFSSFAFQPLSNVTKMLDDLTRGEYENKVSSRRLIPTEDEFGSVVSKVTLLGQQLGNFERLLDQLEEAVLVFGADRHLIVASGALEKFLGKRRVELMGMTMNDVFPPEVSVRFF